MQKNTIYQFGLGHSIQKRRRLIQNKSNESKDNRVFKIFAFIRLNLNLVILSRNAIIYSVFIR